ncbi:SDR family oxidoreductase [Mycobacterium sp. SMC-4]|uniref:SDR family NAD(P)-dependent oxidoreductase n=1 Tax=Mycobacterium sp. SMC-4 TaxID=2857059 RepID=UPI0021B2959A|nr:SDR family NAD(P)-dependent oxidoreductase [Mycobacterium sp. SMC-4]UXA17978.1 SDR family NAD(P)-dependent oxidoreductase [Mycobacterium sp. SMC-4]
MYEPSARVVLITGASTGIGRVSAWRFAAEGARLALAGRDGASLEQVAAQCRDRGAAEVLTQPTDIADRSQVERLFDHATRQLGTPDVVVQNASVAVIGRLTEIPAEVIDALIATDVLGVIYVARAAVQRFTARGSGSLVIVGSLFGHVAVPLVGPYVISKFAVTALVRVLRQETRDHPGVTVHGIYPGAVNTAIYRHAANYLARVPRVPPLADPPEKIAATIVDASYRRRSRDRQVGVVNAPLRVVYRLLPRVFDRYAEPLVRLIGFTGEHTRADSGNTGATADRLP